MDGRGGSHDARKQGATQIDLIVTDGHEGLLAAVSELFTATPRQRCLVHKQRNILNAIPKRERGEIRAELVGIWKQPTKTEAVAQLAAFQAKCSKRYPEAIRSLTEDEEHLLTFYEFPMSRASAYSDDQCHPESGKSMCSRGLIRSMSSRQKPAA